MRDITKLTPTQLRVAADIVKRIKTLQKYESYDDFYNHCGFTEAQLGIAAACDLYARFDTAEQFKHEDYEGYLKEKARYEEYKKENKTLICANTLTLKALEKKGYIRITKPDPRGWIEEVQFIEE